MTPNMRIHADRVTVGDAKGDILLSRGAVGRPLVGSVVPSARHENGRGFQRWVTGTRRKLPPPPPATSSLGEEGGGLCCRVPWDWKSWANFGRPWRDFADRECAAERTFLHSRNVVSLPLHARIDHRLESGATSWLMSSETRQTEMGSGRKVGSVVWSRAAQSARNSRSTSASSAPRRRRGDRQGYAGGFRVSMPSRARPGWFRSAYSGIRLGRVGLV